MDTNWRKSFVILSNNNTATPVFNAPLDVLVDTTFTLQFSVTDNHGLSDNDTMNVLVKNIPPPPPPPLAPPELEEEEDAAEEDTGLAADTGLTLDEEGEYEQFPSILCD